MDEPLQHDGLYATFRGRWYAANRDTDGAFVITTRDPQAQTLGFADRYGTGTYTRVVELAELSGLHRLRHVGTFDGVEVSLSVNARGGVLVGTRDERVAQRLGLPRVDKAWFEREVSASDPALVVEEVHEPIADAAGADDAAPAPVDVDRYFTRYDGNGVPMALLRRHFTMHGHEDQVLRDVDEWKPDAHATVSRGLMDALESDLDEITPEQAAEFQRMVGARSYRPFAS